MSNWCAFFTSRETELMKKNNNGFTLIELMIVVAIIGILAGLAITQYQKYVSRAQVADAVQLLRSSRLAIEEGLNRGLEFPNTSNLSDFSVNNSSSSLVASLTADSATNTITAQFRPDRVTFLLSSKKLVWSYSASTGWKCNVTETDIPNDLKPLDCK